MSLCLREKAAIAATLPTHELLARVASVAGRSVGDPLNNPHDCAALREQFGLTVEFTRPDYARCTVFAFNDDGVCAAIKAHEAFNLPHWARRAACVAVASLWMPETGKEGPPMTTPSSEDKTVAEAMRMRTVAYSWVPSEVWKDPVFSDNKQLAELARSNGIEVTELVARRDALAASGSALASQAIEVEKLLCDALGRPWSAAGISVDSLVGDVKARLAASGSKAECVACEKCGHENWIMAGKAPCQITSADKLAAPAAGWYPHDSVGDVPCEPEAAAPAAVQTKGKDDSPSGVPDEPLWDHKGNVRHAAVDRLRERQEREHATPQTAAPAAQPEPPSEASQIITALCGKWSAYHRPEIGDVIDFIMKVPLTAAPPPAAQSDEARLYHELLFAVGKKHPGESRHETALRYIRQAETDVGDDKAALAHKGTEHG